MRTRRTAYFISGLLIQLGVLAVIVYWFNLVATEDIKTAIRDFAAKLPSFMQDATLVMIIMAALVTISMLCYGAARKLSFSRMFRNTAMGLILLNAILLLWIILTLM